MRANVAEAFKGLAILEQTPDILDTMLSATSAEDRAWRPAPDRWSIDQVLAHLADSEVNNFNRRLRAMANGGTPKLPVYDQEAVVNAERFDGYAELEKLRERRAETVAWLRALPPDVVDRDGVHGEIGRITFGELLHEFAFHDLGHIRQIAELIRARVFYDEIGGFRKYFTVRP